MYGLVAISVSITCNYMLERFYQINIKHLYRQRNGYLVLALLSMVVNIIFVIILMQRASQIILLPPLLKQSVWVKGYEVSPEYLVEMADWFGYLMLTKTAANIKHQHQTLLKYMSSESHNAMQQRLLKEEERYMKDGLSTQWLVQHIKAHPLDMRAHMKGELLTRLGKDVVEKVEKTFELQFQWQHGQLSLTKFLEVKEG